MPSARPSVPCSEISCRMLFNRSGSVRWVIWAFRWLCLATPQQETRMARPRPVFCARSAATPAWFGCARLATLAFAPPHHAGVAAEGRRTIYRKSFTPASIVMCPAFLNTGLARLNRRRDSLFWARDPGGTPNYFVARFISRCVASGNAMAARISGVVCRGRWICLGRSSFRPLGQGRD